MDFIRKEDEGIKEYKYRMYKNKDLYNLKNDEIGDIINKETGENYDESAHRKWAIPYIDGFDTGYEKGFSDASEGEIHEISAELDAKRDELYKQQVKTRDKLREMRADLRSEARLENLKDVFIECANIMSQQHPMRLDKTSVSPGNRVAVLGFSDWHVGEVIENFMNTYNINIFHKRIEKLTYDVIDYCKVMDVSVLKVLNLGDLISGGIHISTRVNNEENQIEQVFIVTEAISAMLLEFAKNIRSVEFYSVTDNHSRINPNKTEHIEKESFARFIPWYLEPRLKDVPNVKIIENRINDVIEYDIGMFDIFHEKALFSHGHNDKLPSMVQNLTLMTRVFPVAIFTGHLHRNYEDEVHGIDLIMSPSGIGSGNYSNSIRKSSMPRQKLTIYENNDGNVERVSTFFINL